MYLPIGKVFSMDFNNFRSKSSQIQEITFEVEVINQLLAYRHIYALFILYCNYIWK